MKKTIIIISSVFLILVASVVTLPILFKDKIVSLIKEEANKSLNAKLNFGDFDLSLIRSFPNFNMKLSDLSIVGINEFENDTLTYIKELEFTLNVLSVIQGDQIEIKSFKLNDPIINAIVLEDGKANWDIEKPSEEPSPEKPEEPSAFKASLKKYEITNGKIIYDDRQGKMFAELTGVNHTGKGDFTQDLFVLNTNTTISKLSYIDAGIKMMNEVNTSFKMDLDMDMPNFKFTFKENEVKLNEFLFGFNGWVSMPTDDIDMDITFSSTKTEFKNLLSLVPGAYSKDFESVKTSGKLAMNGYVKGKYNDSIMPGFGLKLLVENAMFKYPELPKSVNNINIDLKVDNKDGVPDNTIIDLKKFHMEMAANPIDMNLFITTPESDAHIKGGIKGKLILSSVKDFIPLEEGQSINGTIDADVILNGKMSSIEKEEYDQFQFAGQMMISDMLYKSKETPYDINIVKMNLNFTPQFVELTAFESKIGKSDVNANGRIDNLIQYALKDELLTGKFNMNSNLMDLNEFMTESSQPVKEETPKVETALSVIEIPGNINFILSSSIKTLIYDNLEIKDLNGSIKIEDKKVAMENLKMNLLDGSLTMNGSYETKDIKKPGIDFSMEISNFDIQKTAITFNTVDKLAPIAKKCFGKFSTSMKLNGSLDEKMEPVLNTLSGEGKLSTSSVIIENFEPINKIADAIKMEKYKKLDLKNINLSFSFKDGRVNINPFDLKIGNSNVNISGSTGFDQTIDYVWKLDIPSSEFGGAANAAISGLLSKVPGVNLTIPQKIKLNLLLTGTVSSPNVKAELAQGEGASIADDLKNKAKEELEKKKAELEAKARGEADKLKQQAMEKANAEAAKLKSQAEKAKQEAENKAKAEAERIKKESEEKLKQEAKKKLKGLLKP